MMRQMLVGIMYLVLAGITRKVLTDMISLRKWERPR